MSPLTFSMSDSSSGRAYTLDVSGQMDIATVGELRGYIKEVADRDPLRLVIDMRGVSFIESSGIAVLLEAHRALGPRVTLVGIQPPVQHVFDSAGLAGFWNSESTAPDS